MFHDIIPWDDDLDVMVDLRDYPKLKRAFQNKILWKYYNLHGYHDSTNEYDFKSLSNVFPDEDKITSKIGKGKKKTAKTRPRYHKVKIYPVDGKRIRHYAWRWPFIDITFFKQNLTHVWNYDHNKVQYTPIKEFYPLHLRPYMGMWLPVPHKTAEFIKRKYGTFACSSDKWDHKNEMYAKKVSLPCKEIQSAYVKISRHQYHKGTIESVYLSGNHMYSVFVDERIEDATLKYK